MADSNKEHKDVMIAFVVGGIGLILILLYLFGGTHSAQQNAQGEPLPTVTGTAPQGQNAYNYNVAPYNPDPGLMYGKSALPPLGTGCCDDCGPRNGSAYNNVNVAEYMTLAGFGANGGA